MSTSMRVRTRSISVPNGYVLWNVHNRATGAFLYQQRDSFPGVTYTSERITDDTTKLNRGYKFWRECHHNKVEILSKGYGTAVYGTYYVSGPYIYALAGGANVLAKAPPSQLGLTMGNTPDTSEHYQKLTANLAGEMPPDQTVNLGEMLSDLRSPLAMARSSIDSFKKLHKAFSGDTFSDFLRNTSIHKLKSYDPLLWASEGAAGLWLQAVLEIIPLGGDIANLVCMCENINKQLANLNWRNSVETFKIHVTAKTTGTIQQGNQRIEYENSITTTVKASARYDAQQLTAAMMSLSMFRLTTPLTTLWELAPLSFVLDYFVDIAQQLEALQRSHNLVVDYLVPGSLHLHALATTQKSTVTMNVPIYMGPLLYTGPRYKYTTFRRIPLSDPYVMFTEPRLNTFGLTTRRVANTGAIGITALLRQLNK